MYHLKFKLKIKKYMKVKIIFKASKNFSKYYSIQIFLINNILFAVSKIILF